MNARQKAKYYKRKCEELERCPVTVVKERQYPIVDLKLRRTYPAELLYGKSTEEMFNIMRTDLRNAVANDLLDYMTFVTNVDLENRLLVADCYISVVRRH